MSTSRANFTARARVVDLLGREQIADAPTAISELLKNSIDAYAGRAEVRFSTEADCLQIEDNGAGMRTDDLLRKWLVVATESKRSGRDPEYARFVDPGQRRETLRYPQLGEKGIGRLAVAALGRGVLVWTRWGRKEEVQRTLAFIHWSLFQHPRLELNDIVVPFLELSHRCATRDDVMLLMRDMADWLDLHDSYWVSDEEKTIKEGIRNDLNTHFPVCLDALQGFSESMGTLFCVLGTTQEVEELFKSEEKVGEDTMVAEGLRLLLGFCDPFSSDKLRLDAKYLVDGAEPSEERDFWMPEDFRQVDHEIDLSMDENGFVSGFVTRFGEKFDYKYQVRPLPRLSSFPGPLRVHIGYVEGDEKNSCLPPDQHQHYTQRLQAFGALYVYRDRIRVLPYGRIDNDFLGFEERRSRNAGRYFFSHRRMFGAIYLTTDGNPGLRDKAGREGFIKNASYRGFERSLIDLFIDLAHSYYGSDSSREDKKNKREPKDKAKAERAKQRVKKETAKFERDLMRWRRRLPVLGRTLQESSEAFDQALEEFTAVVAAQPEQAEDKSRRCAELLDNLREEFSTARQELGTEVPAIVRLTRNAAENFDRYLSEREQFENSGLRRLAQLSSRYERLNFGVLSAEQRLHNLNDRVDRSRQAFQNGLEQALARFTGALHQTETLAPSWMRQQVTDLEHIFTDAVGEGFPNRVVNDSTGSLVEALETALARQERQYRETYIPFWDTLTEQVRTLDAAEAGEQAIGELNRALEIAVERESTFAELAQLGLVVESLDHEYNVLFRDLRADLQALTPLVSSEQEGAKILQRMRQSFESLEAKLRLLTPLYRRKLGGVGDLTGEEIRSFIERLYSEKERESAKFTYTRSFLTLLMPKVNKPVVLAAAANLVGNALFWTTQTAAKREIRFSTALDGFVVSDSGPGVAARDRERIFEPFFGRRPYGRGLGLYIARTNLEAGGLEVFLSDEPQKNGLAGANFIIRKKSLD